jgi:membrane-bound inhibitor of C-type lysozyme
MNKNIVDTATNEVIGSVVTNQSLTFDQTMELAGFEYVEGNETGWSKDGGRTVYNEETAEIVEAE